MSTAVTIVGFLWLIGLTVVLAWSARHREPTAARRSRRRSWKGSGW